MGSLLSPDMNEALITGEVLTWARKRRNLSEAELAKLINVSTNHILDWEAQLTAPPFPKLIKISEQLKIPLGYFFFSAAPSDEIPLPDFRTIDEFAQRKLSVDALDHINNVLVKQEWYREFAENEGFSEIPFVGKFSTSDDPDEVADSIISTLGIDAALRKSAGSWSGYLSKLISACENEGILVIRSGIVKSSTKRTLSVSEFRGFAISDPFAPVAVINGNDSVAARIFTLVHEAAHIWIGKGGISNSDGSDSKTTLPIESFCNSVSVRVLVPNEEFDYFWGKYSKNADRINKLATTFRVSSIVIVRRALELEKLSHSTFLDLLREAKASQKPIKKPSGGNPERNVRARNSGPVTDSIIKCVRQGNLMYRDAARILAVSIPFLTKMVGKKKELIQ